MSQPSSRFHKSSYHIPTSRLCVGYREKSRTVRRFMNRELSSKEMNRLLALPSWQQAEFARLRNVRATFD